MRFVTLTHRFKRQVLSRVQLVRIIIIILLLSVIFSAWYFLFRPVSQVHLPQHSGRTNILIMGIGGGSHEGSYLTDTLIFASINSAAGNAVLISIPRDLWVPSSQSKLNSAYQTGLAKQNQQAGFILTKSSVSEVINQPVDFSIIIDFSTFTKAVDLVGGIDVNVDRTFDDYEYPVAGKENDLCGGDPDLKCRYETLHFEKGSQHMDGTTALKFARSRHSSDLAEGTDYARSVRQAKIILSFRDKLFSREIITKPKVYQQLYTLAKSSVISDISPKYYPALTRLALKAKDIKIKTFSISSPDQVYNPPISEKYQNQWILLPKNNDPSIIYDFVSSKLK